MGEGLANFPLFVYNNDNLGIFKTGKDKGEKMKAFLILEDGHVFTGRSIGSNREEDDLNFIEVFGCEKAVNACDWVCLKLQKSF